MQGSKNVDKLILFLPYKNRSENTRSGQKSYSLSMIAVMVTQHLKLKQMNLLQWEFLTNTINFLIKQKNNVIKYQTLHTIPMSRNYSWQKGGKTMFGRNKSTRETTRDCSGKSTTNVEASSEVRKCPSCSRKGRNKGTSTKNSRG